MERKIVEGLQCGKGVNQISRELKVGKRRVILTRAKACEAGYLDGRNKLPPYPENIFLEEDDKRAYKSSVHWITLNAHKEWIKERLLSGWHAVTVFEELPIEVQVPRSSFYRFLTRHRLQEKGRSLRRVIPEIVHLPGEALLIDWGFLWYVEEEGKRIKLWAFVGVLGYSRHLVVRLMTKCAQEYTLKALEEMYQELQGVPHRTTSDNPKVFSLKASKYEPLIHPVYERFANHYGTIIECLPPKDPQKKGKVERPIPYVRRLLEGYRGDKNNVGEIQEYLNKKLVLANERKHGTTGERPIDRFLKEEQCALKPLPALAYDVEQYHETTVRIDGHVRFSGKYYSVAEEYIRKTVTILGNSRQVSIYHEGTLIEVHERLTERGRSKSTKQHHLKPWERIRDNEEGLRAIAAKIGPSVEVVVHEILKKGDGYVDLRKIWGILSLNKKFSNSDIDAACTHALSCNCISYRDICFFLEATKEELQAQEHFQSLPRSKFQHSMSEYSQQLLHLKTTKGDTYEH